MIVKKVLSSAAQLTVVSIAIRLLGLLSFPILTRLLSPEHYGIASLATTFIGIFTILAIAGQDSSYVKSFHDSKNYSSEAVDNFYMRYAWVSGLAAAGLSALSWVIYAQWQQVRSSSIIVLFVLFGALGSVLSTFGQVRARLLDRYKMLSIAILSSGIVSTILCITAALIWRKDESALMVAISSYWIVYLILLQTSSKNKNKRLDNKQIKKMMLIGLPLLATAPGYWVISSSDRWFLAASVSSYDLGIYSVGVTIAGLGQIVTSALCNVWYPELSKYMHSESPENYSQLQKVQTIIIWLLMTCTFGICLFGQDLLKLLASSSFQGASNYIPLLAMGLLFYGVNQFQGFGFTMNRKNHIVPVIWLVAVFISIGLNLILVPEYHGMGAAASQCITYFCLSLMTWWFSRSFMPFQPLWNRIIICFLFYAFVVFFSNQLFASLDLIQGILIRAVVSVSSILVALAFVVGMSPAEFLQYIKNINKKRFQ